MAKTISRSIYLFVLTGEHPSRVLHSCFLFSKFVVTNSSHSLFVPIRQMLIYFGDNFLIKTFAFARCQCLSGGVYRPLRQGLDELLLWRRALSVGRRGGEARSVRGGRGCSRSECSISGAGAASVLSEPAATATQCARRPRSRGE